MNQGFKLRFDQMRGNDPTSNELADSTGVGENYSAAGYARNLCLVWPDSRRLFLNYAYLIAGEFEPNSERNVIRLSFSSHTVVLYGYSLELLFMSLLDHLPRLIVAIDPRYVLDEDKTEAIVVEIIVEKKDE